MKKLYFFSLVFLTFISFSSCARTADQRFPWIYGVWNMYCSPLGNMTDEEALSKVFNISITPDYVAFGCIYSAKSWKDLSSKVYFGESPVIIPIGRIEKYDGWSNMDVFVIKDPKGRAVLYIFPDHCIGLPECELESKYVTDIIVELKKKSSKTPADNPYLPFLP